MQLHSKVKPGDTLFQIDRRPFQLAVEKTEANLDNTAQGVAAQTASVKSAVGYSKYSIKVNLISI